MTITPSPTSSGAGAGRLLARLSPLAAATAAPLQSPRRSAGSIWLRRRSSTWLRADRLHPVGHQERVGVVGGRHGEHRVEIAQVAGGCRCFSAQLTAVCPEKLSTKTTHNWMWRSEYSLPVAD